jgi:hypothetical protein
MLRAVTRGTVAALLVLLLVTGGCMSAPEKLPDIVPTAPATTAATVALPTAAEIPTATPTSTPMAMPTLAATASVAALPAAVDGVTRIAVIGDYGLANPAEAEVAALVAGWAPDAVITLGDNNYPFGSAETIDANIGQFYAPFIAPYAGAYGSGGEVNRFWPVLGNHDWQNPGAQAYLDYFTLPGNERYYDVRIGPVHLFALDSMPGEPDGIAADSLQAMWLRDGLAASDAAWKIVSMHHPPYSSGPHAPVTALRWPFGAWGAAAVLAGHDHIYERIVREDAVYFVNGLGGTIIYEIGQPVEGSAARYNADFGAMLIEATPEDLSFQFITRAGEVIDTYTLTR